MMSSRLLIPTLFATVAAFAAGTFLVSQNLGGNSPALDPMPTASTGQETSVSMVTPTTVSQTDVALLKNALDAFETGNLADALAARDAIADGTHARNALDWAIAIQHADALSPNILEDIKIRLAGWPSHEKIAANLETAQLQGAGGLLQRFLGTAPKEPITTSGKLAAADKLIEEGELDAARELVAPLWHTSPLWRALEAEFPTRYGDVLTVDDHRKRYFNMMVRERISAGGRVATLAEMEGLHAAWSSVIRNHASAASTMENVDEAFLETPHGLFMRIEQARRASEIDSAAELLKQLPSNAEERINPDAWWNEIRIVSRMLRERGDHQAAYDIAALHLGGSPVTEVDASFHAGWYALRGLDDPDLAIPHFRAILAVAKGDTSKARGHYWMARSFAAQGQDEVAKAAFKRAAEFMTTYHGQLALAELDEPLQVGQPVHDAVDMSAALRNDAVQAGLLLAEAGQERLSLRLMSGLGEVMKDPGIISALVERLNVDGQHHIALRLAKRAQWHGREIGIATHPVGALPLSTKTERPDLALAYAIARQESEFRLDAVSHADARGLLQLLPSTAADMAQQLELPFEPSRLTTDAAYNTQLGTHYLAEQLERFGGSYVLTFIAYNAGPSRANKWVERFGDPRGLELYELIDWVEQIPFPETRNYVQKVMENLQVYKARLDANPDIVRDLRQGR